MVSRRIGLPGSLYDDVKSIRMEPDYWPQPREYLNEAQRRLVEFLCAEEIEAFGSGKGAGAGQALPAE